MFYILENTVVPRQFLFEKDRPKTLPKTGKGVGSHVRYLRQSRRLERRRLRRASQSLQERRRDARSQEALRSPTAQNIWHWHSAAITKAALQFGLLGAASRRRLLALLKPGKLCTSQSILFRNTPGTVKLCKSSGKAGGLPNRKSGKLQNRRR